MVVLAILALAPHVIDQEEIRTTLSDQLSNALDRPVEIEQISIRLLPSPSVQLNGVSARLDDHPQQQFSIGELRARFSFRRLLQGDLEIQHLSLKGVQLNRQAVNAFRHMFAGIKPEDSAAAMPFRLHSASIRNLYWRTNQQTYGPFRLDADWSSGPKPARIILRDTRHAVQLHVSPVEEQWRFTLHSDRGMFPLDLPVTLDRFTLAGLYGKQQIIFEQISLKGYDSRVQASGHLQWSDDWQLALQARTDSLALTPVLTALGKPALPGSIAGDCAITLQGPAADSMHEHRTVDCRLDYLNQGQQATLNLDSRTESLRDRFTATATNLTLPVGPELHLNNSAFKGSLTDSHMQISSGYIQAYQGEISVSGELDWTDGWRTRFTSQIEDVQLEPLLQVLDQRVISGALTSQCQGSLQAKTTSMLLQGMEVGCNFIISQGVVYETDLERAAQLIKLNETAPPEEQKTPFDQLSGRLTASQQHYRFNELKIASSALAASGNIAINPARELSGEISVGLEKTGKVLSIPLVVAGTTEVPTFRPTRSSMAGAGAGTLILGPGIGTAVGAKIGEAVDNLTSIFKRKNTSE
ncbi:AsmA family protein [Thiohalobacter thiocyanaticus]|nr:AsmA-like C-terminal region-containing protein [Thiohalobacter thiocyanaticus]